MEQAVVRRLKPGTLDAYRALAKERGSSVEAELRALIEAGLPRFKKDYDMLIRLSDEGLAMTPPDGPAEVSDSTLLAGWGSGPVPSCWIRL